MTRKTALLLLGFVIVHSLVDLALAYARPAWLYGFPPDLDPASYGSASILITRFHLREAALFWIMALVASTAWSLRRVKDKPALLLALPPQVVWLIASAWILGPGADIIVPGDAASYFCYAVIRVLFLLVVGLVMPFGAVLLLLELLCAAVLAVMLGRRRSAKA